MKINYKFFLSFFILITNIINGQIISDSTEISIVDSVQVNNAKKFIKYFAKNDSENAWNLFDKENFQQLTKEKFIQAMNQVYIELSHFNDYNLVYNGKKYSNNQELKFYTFKAISNENMIDDVNINIYFFKSSNLVGGIQPEKKVKETSASTTKGKETELEKSLEIKINGKIYNIKGINIVHFENNQGLLTIQVEYPMQENNDIYKTEAPKFAKYLVKNGYLKKAKIKVKEINLKLIEDIGISFIDTEKNSGFNVMLKPNEYK